MHILLCGRLNIETMMWRTGQGGLSMHEYEIIHEIVNACGGAGRAETAIIEADAESPEAYMKSVHPDEFDKAVRSEKDGAVVYTLALGAVTHKYTFQE